LQVRFLLGTPVSLQDRQALTAGKSGAQQLVKMRALIPALGRSQISG